MTDKNTPPEPQKTRAEEIFAKITGRKETDLIEVNKANLEQYVKKFSRDK